jgi:hypothetical protein
VNVTKDGYEEARTIPRAERSVVEPAIQAAVREGKLWLTSGPASILAEEIPAGLLTDDARLQVPPPPIPPTDLLPSNLPEAWSGDTTTALAISVALSRRAAKTLPWATVREAIDVALRIRILERSVDSGPWPCGFPGAQAVKLRVPTEAPPPPPPPPPPGRLVAEADLRVHEIQNLGEQAAELMKLATGLNPTFRVRIEAGGVERPAAELVAKLNRILRDVSDRLELK